MDYVASYKVGNDLIVKPVVSYAHGAARAIREAEQARQASEAAYEREGFSWDEEYLGWALSSSQCEARFPDASFQMLAEWAEGLSDT